MTSLPEKSCLDAKALKIQACVKLVISLKCAGEACTHQLLPQPFLDQTFCWELSVCISFASQCGKRPDIYFYFPFTNPLSILSIRCTTTFALHICIECLQDYKTVYLPMTECAQEFVLVYLTILRWFWSYSPDTFQLLDRSSVTRTIHFIHSSGKLKLSFDLIH